MTSSPTPGHQPWGQESCNESRPSRVLMVSNMNAFWRVAVEVWTFEKLAYKTLSQCDGNADADADDRGDCNSSPCTLYRRAKNTHLNRLHPSDVTPCVFKTTLCKSLPDLINAFCRYETMSFSGIYRTIRNVIWLNRIRKITKCNRFSCW